MERNSGLNSLLELTPADVTERHPIFVGLWTPFTSISSLYEVSPLTKSTRMLLIGAIPDKEPEPVAYQCGFLGDEQAGAES